MPIYFTGLIIGIASFLIIGIFHPIVVKTEYYFGTRPWWIFLVLGLAGAAGALFIADALWSSLLSVLAFTCLWTIKELFEQEERVLKNWFPENPARHEYYVRRREELKQKGITY